MSPAVSVFPFGGMTRPEGLRFHRPHGAGEAFAADTSTCAIVKGDLGSPDPSDMIVRRFGLCLASCGVVLVQR